MLNLFKRQHPSTSNHQKLAELMEEISQRIELRFNELSAQVREVELAVKELEVKLLTKDLRDRQQMGAIHYKLHEKVHRKNEDELNSLELELNLKRRLSKDQ